jgi:GNAT superfamily N-acetyltransferase
VTTNHRDPCADPRLVETWVEGWALARGTPPPVPAAGALRIDVGLPQQKARYVFAEASPAVAWLAERIEEPWVFIKVCAPPTAVRALLPPRWQIQAPAFMMTQDLLSAGDVPALANGYKLELTAEPPLLTAAVVDASTQLAASGRVVLSKGYAVFDQIVTHEDHQRRGLGRAVMRALEQAAVNLGATHGILVATAEGRHLYEALRWKLHSPYTSAVISSGQKMD